MKKVLIINGPNLNLLGTREPDVYGTTALDDINKELKTFASTYDLELVFFQSNSESAIIEAVHKAPQKGMDLLIINAGAYTHTSIAIRDAISSVPLQAVEVHISNTKARESFRHVSLLSPVCAGCIEGFGLDSYKLAVFAASLILNAAAC